MTTPRTWTNYEHKSKLSEARMAKGLTYQQLSEMVGVLPQRIATLSTGTTAPIFLKTGQIKPWVEKACLILEIAPEEAFPRYFCSLADTPQDAPDQLIPEDYLFSDYATQTLTEPAEIAAERRELVRLLLHLLDDKPKIQRTVELRFLWGYTFDEVAKVFGCTRERARQMEAKGVALMKGRKKEVEQ